MNNSLQQKIVHFVYVCIEQDHDDLLNTLIKELAHLEEIERVSRVRSNLNLPFELDYLIYEVFQESVDYNIKPFDLINGLEIAYKMRKLTINYQTRVTPVWTGPSFDRGLIQYQTLETVKKLIETATDEIFIVGYNFSFRNDVIQELLRELESAADRNCKINLIVNSEEKNYGEIKNNWKREPYLLNIYSWVGVNNEDYSSLHAKLIIIDQEKMLLTSANFSYHGFMKNIETGLVIENHKVIRNIWKQYQSLLRNNQMIKVY